MSEYIATQATMAVILRLLGNQVCYLTRERDISEHQIFLFNHVNLPLSLDIILASLKYNWYFPVIR